MALFYGIRVGNIMLPGGFGLNSAQLGIIGSNQCHMFWLRANFLVGGRMLGSGKEKNFP